MSKIDNSATVLVTANRDGEGDILSYKITIYRNGGVAEWTRVDVKRDMYGDRMPEEAHGSMVKTAREYREALEDDGYDVLVRVEV